MAKTGLKHLIACRCVLPQFKSMTGPPVHRFVVFSVIDENGQVEPRLAQCNNCGIVHRVTDLTRSDIITGHESSQSIKTIDDIRVSMTEQLAAILDRAGADLATWEAVLFCLEEQRWGDIVILTSDVVDGTRQGKYVRVLGPNLFKVDTFSRDEITCRD